MKILIALFLAAIAGAQPTPHKHSAKQVAIFIGSAAILVAGTYVDMHSSFAASARPGLHEANPLLSSSDGKFHTKGAAIMGSITGATLAWQASTWKSAPEAINATIGIVHFAAAHHNNNLNKENHAATQ